MLNTASPCIPLTSPLRRATVDVRLACPGETGDPGRHRPCPERIHAGHRRREEACRRGRRHGRRQLRSRNRPRMSSSPPTSTASPSARPPWPWGCAPRPPAAMREGSGPHEHPPAVGAGLRAGGTAECGEVVDGVLDVVASRLHPHHGPAGTDKINALLGTDVSREEMVKILTDLGFLLLRTTCWWCPPLARGTTCPTTPIWPKKWPGSWLQQPAHHPHAGRHHPGFHRPPEGGASGGEVCRGLGYNEILTLPFIAPAYYNKIRLPENDPAAAALPF